jgi:UDP-glucuronate decarboxylase
MHPNDGRVVSNFIMQALQNIPITIYGEGQQSRSFCYVDDLVDGLIAMMDHDDLAPQPINMGNPAEMTIRELAETIIDMTGSASKLIFKPMPEDDPLQRQPDISRARKLLGWQPTTPLRTGLKRTITYFEGVLAKG